jgi:hypothetical protein
MVGEAQHHAIAPGHPPAMAHGRRRLASRCARNSSENPLIRHQSPPAGWSGSRPALNVASARLDPVVVEPHGHMKLETRRHRPRLRLAARHPSVTTPGRRVDVVNASLRQARRRRRPRVTLPATGLGDRPDDRRRRPSHRSSSAGTRSPGHRRRRSLIAWSSAARSPGRAGAHVERIAEPEPCSEPRRASKNASTS